MTLSATHILWAYQHFLARWREEGLDRYAIRQRLIDEFDLRVGVDSIRYVLDHTPRPDAARAVEARAAVPPVNVGSSPAAISAVPAGTAQTAGEQPTAARLAAPAGAAQKPVPQARLPRFYLCGKPVEIAAKNNAKHGWVRGQPKPCPCAYCGPVDVRIGMWEYWTDKHYTGWYLCVGVRGITVGCDQLKLCAGPSPEQMICRECFNIPPAPRPTGFTNIVRKV